MDRDHPIPWKVGRKGLGEGFRDTDREMWTWGCAGNGDQGMLEIQTLSVSSCPSPPFTGWGSSSWELAGQSQRAARCCPSGLKGLDMPLVSLCTGWLGMGGSEGAPCQLGGRSRAESSRGHRPGSIILTSELTFPGIPEGRGLRGGCCSSGEAEEGKGTQLIVTSQCTERKGNRSVHTRGEPCPVQQERERFCPSFSTWLFFF